MTEFILNNTVLSNYSSVAQLDLIRRVLKSVSITPQVLDEVIKAVEGRIFGMDEGNRILSDFIKKGYRSPIANLGEALHPADSGP